MTGRVTLLLALLLPACGGDEGGRATADGATQTAGVSSVGGTVDLTEGTGSSTAETPTSGADASTSGPVTSMTSMTGMTGMTSMTSTGDASDDGDDSFPETSVSSLITSSGFDTVDPPDCAMVLDGVVRDFKVDHPDFEYNIDDDKGIVLPDLGADNKPVYAGQDGNPTTTGQANFDQWYRDVAEVNIPSALQIPLADQGGGLFTYDNPAFFPIDNQGWGNEGNEHNFHFTLEIHTMFAYKGGEVFTFRGDDDVFVFINRKLAIDLGGVHGPEQLSADLDALAGQLGITPGNTYALDFFFAERHTSESNFRIETTIQCLQPPG